MSLPKVVQPWAYLLVCIFVTAACPAFAEEQEMSPGELDAMTSSEESEGRAVNGRWAYTFEVPAPLDVPTCTDVQALILKVDELNSSVANHVIHLSNKMHDMSERIDDVLAKVERQISTDQPRQADEQSEAGDETQKYPKDCSEVASLGNTKSGVYLIQPSAVTYSLSEKSPCSPMQPFYVYCHMDGEEGWTVIQRREDGSENFNRTWADYKQGFGNPWREYWIGNDRLHVLTTHARYKLQVYLVDWEGRSGYAVYKRFVVEGEEDEYRLRVGSYFGTVGDSLVSHRNYEFSTWDREQGYNCTPKYRAGWWHRHCSYSYFTNLNGRYKEGQSFSPTYDGVEWYQWKKKQGYSLRFVEMRVIPIG